jgi:hypothetical protein
MIPVVLDDRYTGSTRKVTLEKFSNGSSVIGEIEENGDRFIRFLFPDSFTRDGARQYIRNRGLNNIYFRREENGRVFIKKLYLTTPVGTDIICSQEDTASIDRAKAILGKSKFDALSKIEMEHNGDVPFLLGVIPMAFHGKDSIIANGIEFYREQVTEMIKKFVNLPVHLGHLGMFEDYQDRIANTVSAEVDENGDPFTWNYIYPHGKGAEIRNDLKIAAAQGMLGTFRISMTGDPVEYDEVDEDDKDYERGIYVRMRDWVPESQDFVYAEAAAGSRAIEIVNRRGGSNIKISNLNDEEIGGEELKNMSEILVALKEHSVIALSDLMLIPAIRTAVESHIQVKVDEAKKSLSADKEFMSEAIELCDNSILLESARVKSVVDSKVQDRKNQIDADIEKINKIASVNGVNLSEDQAFLVKTNLDGEQTDAEILNLIKTCALIKNGLGGIKGRLFSNPDENKDNKVRMSAHGASVERVGIEQMQDDMHSG